MDSFFGIGMPELILILVIAGVVMGPERIGRAARWLGKTTAQLQVISRGFVQQLQNEIDGVDNDDAIKDTMREVNALRHELESLRSELSSSTKGVVKEGKSALHDIENSIKPPSLPQSKSFLPPQIEDDKSDTAVPPTNGAADDQKNGTKSTLPNLLDIPEDPD